MPQTKRKTHTRSDSFVASDSSPQPPSKRSKNPTSFHPAASDTLTPQTDSEGNPYWPLSTARRVTVSTFKNKKMVSVREYYEKDGVWLPGKKGITMTLEQYAELVRVLPDIEKALGKEGREVGRPDYAAAGEERNGNGVVGDTDEGEGDGEGGERVKVEGDEDAEEERKANIEATSDEDEG